MEFCMKKLLILVLLSVLAPTPTYGMEDESKSSDAKVSTNTSISGSDSKVLYQLHVQMDARGIPKIVPIITKNGVTTKIPYKPSYNDTISNAVNGTTYTLRPNKPIKLYPKTEKYICLSPCGKFLLYSDFNDDLYHFPNVYLYNLDRGTKFKFNWGLNTNQYSRGNFSPDGTRFLLFQAPYSYYKSSSKKAKIYNIERFPPKKLKMFWGQDPRWSENSAFILSENERSFSIRTKNGKQVFKGKYTSFAHPIKWLDNNSVQVMDLDSKSQKALNDIHKTTKKTAELKFLLEGFANKKEFECTTVSIPDNKKRSLMKRLLNRK
jgi:hypothetical protein